LLAPGHPRPRVINVDGNRLIPRSWQNWSASTRAPRQRLHWSKTLRAGRLAMSDAPSEIPSLMRG
jgi:hypothetical protein